MILNIYEVLKSFPGLSKQLTCKDMLFTNYDCPQIEKEVQLYVECSFIAYVISGRRIFHKNNQSWDLSEGTCVFVKKGTHIVERPEGEGWCVMVFFMPDHFLKALINDHRTSLPMAELPEAAVNHILPLEVNELSRSFFLSMLPYFSQSPPPNENLLELKFKELVLSLLCSRNNERFLSYLDNLSHDKIPSIEEVMQNNFTFNLTLEEYAKLAYKSLPTFKREFKKIFNDTPAKWIMKKRLQLAADLLQNTPQSISEITYACGFENPTHFSRLFKEKMGISPLQYRTNARASTLIDG